MIKYLLILLVFCSGCTHALHQYHAGDTEPFVRGKSNYKRIKSMGEQFAVMGFVTETNYVNAAYDELKSKCPKGTITGIHTRYSTSHGFFSWTNRVKMTGYCVK